MRKTPSFDEAQHQLREFLAGQGHPTELAWVFREDVLLSPSLPPRVVVRLPLPGENVRAAHALFEHARARGLGVQVVALCRIGSQVACYVWEPESSREQDTAMMSSTDVKLSIREPLEDAVRVTRTAAWPLRKLGARLRERHTFIGLMPSRRAVDELSRRSWSP
jgi:hypothetical protein